MQKLVVICHLCHHRVFFLFSQPLQNCEPVAISLDVVARIPVPAPTILLTRRCKWGIYERMGTSLTSVFQRITRQVW